MIPEPAFRELRVGRWEHIPFGQLRLEEPDLLRQFSYDPVHWQVDGSESYEAYTGRFLEALHRILQNHTGRTVAVFSHAAVMRGVIMKLFPEAAMVPTDNTCVTELDYHDGKFSLLRLNDNSHLPAEISTLAGRKHGQIDLHFEETAHLSYRVMSARESVGSLVLETCGTEGRILHMELAESLRGGGRALQLLGKAVFTFRRMGIRQLLFEKPMGCLDSLCKRMELKPNSNGLVVMDLHPWMPTYIL